MDEKAVKSLNHNSTCSPHICWTHTGPKLVAQGHAFLHCLFSPCSKSVCAQVVTQPSSFSGCSPSPCREPVRWFHSVLQGWLLSDELTRGYIYLRSKALSRQMCIFKFPTQRTWVGGYLEEVSVSLSVVVNNTVEKIPFNPGSRVTRGLLRQLKAEGEPSHGIEGPYRGDGLQSLPFVLAQLAPCHSEWWGNTLSSLTAHEMERKGQGGVPVWLKAKGLSQSAYWYCG